MAHEPAAADGLPDTARAVDMRRTYPAGRILHLVPASAAFLGSGEPQMRTQPLNLLRKRLRWCTNMCGKPAEVCWYNQLVRRSRCSAFAAEVQCVVASCRFRSTATCLACCSSIGSSCTYTFCLPSTGSDAAASRSSSSGLSGDGDAAAADTDADYTVSSRLGSRFSTAAAAAVAAIDGAATVGSAAADGAAAAAAAQRASDRAVELATPGEAAEAAAHEANGQAASAWQQEPTTGDPPWPGAAAAPELPPQPQPLLLDAAERSGQPEAEAADTGQPYVLLEGVPHEVRIA